jgi:hypothetical protein
MITQAEIRRELLSYLRNAKSLADFENWIASHSWNMHLDSDQEAIDLADDVEVALSEYSNSPMTIQELRARLLELATRAIVVNVNMDAPQYRAASSLRIDPPVLVCALA